MPTIAATTRLADWLERDVRKFWEEHGEGPSVGLRRVVEEWWALQHYPAIEFRDGVSGRRACLREGPDVWEIIMVLRDYGTDLDALAAHFDDRISQDALRQAVAYAERFPEEIGGRIEENERVARYLSSHSEAR